MATQDSTESYPVGETVSFRGNEPDGTPADFSGIVLELRGGNVAVSVYGYSQPCWLPLAMVAVEAV